MQKSQKIVVIGAGVFGLSTALELAQQGFSNVTVLDRHPPPVCIDVRFFQFNGVVCLAQWNLFLIRRSVP